MEKLRENKLTADVLMTSMRSMGYSFESAVADIIDNSISAHANQISVCFPVDPSECYVAIRDNGEGMISEELFDAMKYGSKNKRDSRSSDDLGHYDLGLKSASLSQCRRLSVISKNVELFLLIYGINRIVQNKGQTPKAKRESIQQKEIERITASNL